MNPELKLFIEPKAILILLTCLLGSMYSFSQFSDSVHYYLNYSSTGIINNTNDANSYVLTNTLKFNINRKKITINTFNSWIYGQQQRNLTNNDYISSIDFNTYDSLKRIYYWGLLNYTTSYSLKINNQFQGGLGIGYKLTRKKGEMLTLSDGILYERSDLIDPRLGPDEYHTFRNSFRIKYRWVVKEILVLDGSNYLQNSLSSWEDYIIKLNNSISVKLKKWLSLTASMNYNKVNRTGRENMLINFGVTVEKYF